MVDVVKLVPPVERVWLEKLTATDGKANAGVELENGAAGGAAPVRARPRRRGGARGVPVAARREAAVDGTLSWRKAGSAWRVLPMHPASIVTDLS